MRETSGGADVVGGHSARFCDSLHSALASLPLPSLEVHHLSRNSRLISEARSTLSISSHPPPLCINLCFARCQLRAGQKSSL